MTKRILTESELTENDVRSQLAAAHQRIRTITSEMEVLNQLITGYEGWLAWYERHKETLGRQEASHAD